MTDGRYNILFLCTGNSARSILAESILRKDGGEHFRAFSAGSDPKHAVNRLALETLERAGYPTEGLRPKSWSEFAVPGAPEMDFVFTVCDNAAGEACPIWPGQPMTAHWGIEDPAAVDGTDIAKRAAFAQVMRYLKARVGLFTALPFASLDRLTILEKVVEIGQLAGASKGASATLRVGDSEQTHDDGA